MLNKHLNRREQRKIMFLPMIPEDEQIESYSTTNGGRPPLAHSVSQDGENDPPCVSLLDKMHKKFCPDQYKKRDRVALSLPHQFPAIPADLLPSPSLTRNKFQDLSLAEIEHSTVTTSSSTDNNVVDTSFKRYRRSKSLESPTRPIIYYLSWPQCRRFSDSSCQPTRSCSEIGPLSRKKITETHPNPLSNDAYHDDDGFIKGRLSPKLQCRIRLPEICCNEDEVTFDIIPSFEVNSNDDAEIEEVDNSLRADGESTEEVEAVEACEWLKLAGFPQYAQMYKDQAFPIDLKAAERDHDFLDQDALQAVFRRLDVLNKCSKVKHKQHATPPTSTDKSSDDSDDDQQCALSDRWKYQRNSRQWSRQDSELSSCLPSAVNGIPPTDGKKFTDSPDSTTSSMPSNSPIFDRDSISREPSSLRKPQTLPLNPSWDLSNSDLHRRRGNVRLEKPNDMGKVTDENCFLNVPVISYDRSPVNCENSSNPLMSPRLRRAADKLRGAWSILKKMESLTLKKPSRRINRGDITKLDIGSPTMEMSTEIQAKMNRLGCVDISPTVEQNVDNMSFASSTPKELYKGESRNIPTDTQLRNSGVPPQVTGKPKAQVSHSLPASVPMHDSFYQNCDKDSSLKNFGGESSSPVISRPDSRSSSVDRDEVKDFVTELLTINSKLSSTATSSQPRIISVYDNVCSPDRPELELDLILNELYKNIISLDNSLSGNRTDDSSRSFGELSTPITPSSGFDSSEYFASPALSTQQVTVQNVAQKPSGNGNESRYSPWDACIEEEDCFNGSKSTDETTDQEANNRFASSDPESVSSADHRDQDWSYPEGRERRDSGVGSSLTRSSSSKRQKRPRIRWHSFAKSHQPSLSTCSQQINHLSAGRIGVLRKLSLLKVTAMLEKYSPANRTNWNWLVPRIKKSSKAQDYSCNNIFGVPLAVLQQRTGQPLPQCFLYAMRRLRRTGGSCDGIFRKSGVRSRVQTLRAAVESDPDSVDFDDLPSHDVADLLKLFFRELPECLLTNKLSNVFVSIFQYVPAEFRVDSLQAAVLLLPDENRETLQSLLLFLGDLAQYANQNKMNASNLAVCFAPSLFHLSGTKPGHSRNASASPKSSKNRTYTINDKHLIQQKAAHECLMCMIDNAKKIFTVPEEMLSKCHLTYLEDGDPVSLEELVRKNGNGKNNNNYVAYVESCIQGVLKESRDKFKGWVSTTSNETDVDLAYKKVGDGHPLRLWKYCVNVEAPPEEVLNRVLRERHMWDDDILKWRVVEKLDGQTEVFQHVLNSMAPHPTLDFCELRSWRTDLPRGVCALISTSIEHPESSLMGGVRGVVLASRYLIEPCGSGKSRLTHISRIDMRGHSLDWYNQVYGQMCTVFARRIRDSFKGGIKMNEGPETKV